MLKKENPKRKNVLLLFYLKLFLTEEKSASKEEEEEEEESKPLALLNRLKNPDYKTDSSLRYLIDQLAAISVPDGGNRSSVCYYVFMLANGNYLLLF
jgi:hypothetical protein